MELPNANYALKIMNALTTSQIPHKYLAQSISMQMKVLEDVKNVLMENNATICML